MSSKPGTFRRGADPRRNSRGNLNAEAQSWEIRFRNALAKKLNPDKAADLVVKAYLRAQAWAVAETHERLMGRVTQPFDHSGEIDGKLTVEFVTIKDEEPAE